MLVVIYHSIIPIAGSSVPHTVGHDRPQISGRIRSLVGGRSVLKSRPGNCIDREIDADKPSAPRYEAPRLEGRYCFSRSTQIVYR